MCLAADGLSGKGLVTGVSWAEPAEPQVVSE